MCNGLREIIIQSKLPEPILSLSVDESTAWINNGLWFLDGWSVNGRRNRNFFHYWTCRSLTQYSEAPCTAETLVTQTAISTFKAVFLAAGPISRPVCCSNRWESWSVIVQHSNDACGLKPSLVTATIFILLADRAMRPVSDFYLFMFKKEFLTPYEHLQCSCPNVVPMIVPGSSRQFRYYIVLPYTSSDILSFWCFSPKEFLVLTGLLI